MTVLRPTSRHWLRPGTTLYHGTRASGFHTPRGPAWFASTIGVAAHFAFLAPGKSKPKAMQFTVVRAPQRIVATNYAMDILDTARMIRTGSIDYDYETDPFSGPGGFRKAEAYLCEQDEVDGVVFLEGERAEVLLCDPAQWLGLETTVLLKKAHIDYDM